MRSHWHAHLSAIFFHSRSLSPITLVSPWLTFAKFDYLGSASIQLTRGSATARRVSVKLSSR